MAWDFTGDWAVFQNLRIVEASINCVDSSSPITSLVLFKTVDDEFPFVVTQIAAFGHGMCNDERGGKVNKCN